MVKQTLYGGKNGIDYICMADVGGDLAVMASGKKTAMLNLGREKNYVVAKIETIRFIDPVRSIDDQIAYYQTKIAELKKKKI
jgi:hypothetical protein